MPPPHFSDDADSSIYISARTSQTSAGTRDNTSQEVAGEHQSPFLYGGLHSYRGDMTAKHFAYSPPNVAMSPTNPSPATAGVMNSNPNSVLFNNYTSKTNTSAPASGPGNAGPSAVLHPPIGFFQSEAQQRRLLAQQQRQEQLRLMRLEQRKSLGDTPSGFSQVDY